MIKWSTTPGNSKLGVVSNAEDFITGSLDVLSGSGISQSQCSFYTLFHQLKWSTDGIKLKIICGKRWNSIFETALNIETIYNLNLLKNISYGGRNNGF